MEQTFSVMPGKPYFCKDGKPFFWLGDTAWLLFTKIAEQDAFAYLENRARKGFNVIQADLIHSFKARYTQSEPPFAQVGPTEEAYWRHCDRVIDKAAELGLTMALLPSWGAPVKDGTLNTDNVERYARFLAERYGNRENVLWLLGGDIKAAGYEEYYDRLGTALKSNNPQQLIGYHPFGRCSSSLWLNDAGWLDFHMFQSGHRRYDQCAMGAWDDTANEMSLYGEDNWRYVLHDRAASARPVLDGEPSYEEIPQGLHDDTQPYWTAREVRRYAYWSVLAGAAGHTYGHNSVMQFYDPADGVKGSYGAKTPWKQALDAPGAGQMQILKRIVESVDYTNGRPADELLPGGQREKHGRVAVFAGKDFLLAYSYTGEAFSLDVKDYRGKTLRRIDPGTGEKLQEEKVDADVFSYRPEGEEKKDVVVLVCNQQ